MLFLLVLLISFISTPILISFWWCHALISIFTVWNIAKASHYYLFWFLFVVVLLFSSEPRLSLEYFLISASLISFASSDSWTKLESQQRRNILLACFIAFALCDYLDFGLVEKGSILMLLPVFLAMYFPLQKLDFKINKQSISQLVTYGLSFIAILFSNKRATLFAYLASIKNLLSKKMLLLSSVLVIACSFLVKDNIANFYRKSIEPRTLIWQAAFKGAMDKPIFGHGFATYTIDFPPYRMKNLKTHGAKEIEYVVHAHNQIFQSLFEWGILGGALFLTLLILIYKYANNAFLPFLVASVFNVSLQSFTQIFLIALLLNPLNMDEKIFAKLKQGILSKVLKILLIFATTILLTISTLGHYFYDNQQLGKAIKIDSWHPLYYFSRGASKINSNIEQSKADLAVAVELAPGIGFFHAFYAATLLATQEIKEAKYHIDRALMQMGEDPYLLILSSFINQDNKEESSAHYKRALELNPDLEYLLHDPSYTADEFIGVKSSNPRIMSFYRRGRKIYLPLPYLE